MRVLFFHPSNYLEIGIPQGIAILSAVLRREGHEVALFDTTFLKPKEYVYNPEQEQLGPVLYKKPPYTIDDLVKDDRVSDIVEEFRKKIAVFKPDLIAVSTMTTSYDFAISVIRKVRPGCKVLFGGVHPTISPEEVIGEHAIDMICVGEGEEAIAELCRALDEGSDFTNIRNLWVKTGGREKFKKNNPRPFVELDSLPCPDWSLFDPRHLYRPFMGKIYKGSLYVSSRGCPCKCTYCVNSNLQVILKDCGRYFRYQKPETTIAHIKELKEKYGATWFKFGDDTFLLQTINNLELLRDGLRPLNIQFGCSIRPDTITFEKAKLAKEMGCVAMSIGIESGNEELRRKILNRQISDKQMENAFKIINDLEIRISTFNLIGLPGETRENVFETVRFNKKMNVKSANVYIVYPFPGSQISVQYKTRHRLRSGKIIPMSSASVFHLSKMLPEEVVGLEKTFNLYLYLPEELWPIIKLAEGNDKASQEIFAALNKYASTVV